MTYCCGYTDAETSTSLSLFGAPDNPVCISHWKQTVPEFTYEQTETYVFRQISVQLFGQSSDELSHLPKRSRLSEETNAGLFKADQTALACP